MTISAAFPFDLPMPALLSAARRLPAHVVVGSSPRVLRAGRRRGINLAVWTRPAPPAHRDAFISLARVDFSIDVRLDVQHLSAARVRELLPPATATTDAARSMLCEDVACLAGRFSRLTGAQRVRLKLQAVGGDECRLFHVDTVSWRMMTTWAGPGTDWLENDACRREHLGGAGLPHRASVDMTNAAIVTDWTKVHRLDRYAVAFCRGATACDAHTVPLVHRSPPIAGTGLRRLRLVIDDADAGASHAD